MPSVRFARVAAALERRTEQRDAASAAAAVAALAKIGKLSSFKSAKAVLRGRRALDQAEAKADKAHKAAAAKAKARKAYRRPVFVHPYHSFKELDRDERVVSMTEGFDDGTLGYEDVESHLDSDPLAALDTVAPNMGGRAQGGETEIQG